MKNNGKKNRLSAWLYGVVIAVLFFSGFGQMPIFKRYYLADIPGMAWAADFYITHAMHYIAAALLLGILAYALTAGKTFGQGSAVRGWARILVYGLLVLSGVVLTVKNLPGWDLPPALIVTADLTHLAGSMIFLALGAYFVFIRRPAREKNK